MHAPQIILLAISALNLITHAGSDGKPLPYPNHSFGLAFCRSAILLGLLYWGGFFS